MCTLKSPPKHCCYIWSLISHQYTSTSWLCPIIVTTHRYSLCKSGTSSCVKRERRAQGVCFPLISFTLLWKLQDPGAVPTHPLSVHHQRPQQEVWLPCTVAPELWSIPVPSDTAAVQQVSCLTWICVNMWTSERWLQTWHFCMAFSLKSLCSKGSNPGCKHRTAPFSL